MPQCCSQPRESDSELASFDFQERKTTLLPSVSQKTVSSGTHAGVTTIHRILSKRTVLNCSFQGTEPRVGTLKEESLTTLQSVFTVYNVTTEIVHNTSNVAEKC